MTTFIEARLLDCVAYGTAGGPTWATRKVNLKNGIVKRNPMRVRPLYKFALIYKNIKPADHTEVIAAFNACFGGAISFRLKDWSDFQAVDEELSVLGTGAPQTLQLVKAYNFGTQTILRKIRKPVTGTVVIKASGSMISSTIDYTTGMATYTATSGAVVTWSGQFDVPVMFDDDELSFSADDLGSDGLFLNSDVSLIEDLAV